MRLYTKLAYKNRTLHLPIVGPTELDAQASFECDDDLAQQVITASKGSLEFLSSSQEANAIKPIEQSTETDSPEQKKLSTKITDEEILQSVVKRKGVDWVAEQLGLTVISTLKSEDVVQPKKVETPKEVKQNTTKTVTPQVTGQPQTEVKTSPDVPQSEQPQGDEPFIGDEEMVEEIKQAITDAQGVDDLLQYVELIPNINKAAVATLGEPELRAFLLKKVEDATKKK